MQAITINSERLKEDFDRLAEIGATGDGGVHRPALTENHLLARKWFKDKVIQDGFEFHLDGAGNHSAILRGSEKDAKTILLGSHLDSVPYGGRFDGALGVLVALEVLRTIREQHLTLPYSLEVIDFTDEEGTLVGLMGSRALVGALTIEDLTHPKCELRRFREMLTGSNLTEPGILAAANRKKQFEAFLEIHIEQGPRLIHQGLDIGIVTTIVGIHSFRMEFTGQADHAGTTPIINRKDAGLAAARYMVAGTDLILKEFPGCVVNFGTIKFSPGAYNIVPAQAELAVEFRAASEATLADMDNRLVLLAHEIAGEAGLSLAIEPRGCVGSVDCSEEVIRTFEEACEITGASHTRLVSGAGHDTMSLAKVCPSGMIFIPSTGGSHNPAEFASWDAIVKGANVILNSTLLMAGMRARGPG